MIYHAPDRLVMKRIIKETVVIVILSLLLSLAYTVVSPNGMPLFRKAFNIKAVNAKDNKSGAGQNDSAQAVK